MSIFTKVSNWGVDAKIPPYLARRIRSTNLICLSLAMITAPYGIVFYVLNVKLLAWLILPIVSIYFLWAYLNTFRLYNLSRIGLIISFNCSVALYTSHLGTHTSIQLLYFPIICLPLIVFESSRRWLISISMLLPVTIFSAFAIFPNSLSNNYLLSELDYSRLTIILIVTSFAIQAFSVLYLYNEFDRGERNLADRQFKEREKKDHYYNQMEKVFYPHQLAMMREGKILENTMPIGKAQACVIAFDIANSFQIGHSRHHEFFQNVMAKCQDLMNVHYDPQLLTATAFRIKEMGDGFLCSIGFPFKISGTTSLESVAYRLANDFIAVFTLEVESYFKSKQYTCGIGIAKGEVEGFFPSSGTREYDLYGDGIIHATRYESMRKNLTPLDQSKNIIIIQESVYKGLGEVEKSDLIEVDLKKAKLFVRDDASADKIYFKTIANSEIKIAASM